jgi:hypothetical protein
VVCWGVAGGGPRNPDFPALACRLSLLRGRENAPKADGDGTMTLDSTGHETRPWTDSPLFICTSFVHLHLAYMAASG